MAREYCGLKELFAARTSADKWIENWMRFSCPWYYILLASCSIVNVNILWNCHSFAYCELCNLILRSSLQVAALGMPTSYEIFTVLPSVWALHLALWFLLESQALITLVSLEAKSLGYNNLNLVFWAFAKLHIVDSFSLFVASIWFAGRVNIYSLYLLFAFHRMHYMKGWDRGSVRRSLIF